MNRRVTDRANGGESGVVVRALADLNGRAAFDRRGHERRAGIAAVVGFDLVT